MLVRVVKRRGGEAMLAGRIVEVEVYLGADDAAAHSAAGKTARNAVLFGPPGHAYVYFIYGNHFCFNVSCMPEGDAGCVLIRALEPVAGIEEMARNRGLVVAASEGRAAKLRLLTSGPGRLCQALGITRPHDNGKDLTSRQSDLWIGDDQFKPGEIATTARIGITRAAEQPLRYVIAQSPFVSGNLRIPKAGAGRHG